MNQYVVYDPEADTLYVHLANGAVDRTRFVDDFRAIDYHEDVVIGIEFINASDGVDLRDLPFADTVERLIGESGHRIPIYA